MTWMTERARPGIFAEPRGEHAWRVCRNDAGTSLLDHTIGYIDELGGTYEVRVLAAPSQRQYVPTFKEAMDCFGPKETAARESTDPEPAARGSAADEVPKVGLTAVASAVGLVPAERAS